MRLCRACNTRFEGGLRACPSCGRRAADFATDAGSTGPGFSAGTTGPLPPAEPLDDGMETEVGFDLEPEAHERVEAHRSPRRAKRPVSRSRKPDTPSLVGRVREPGPSVLALEASQVRTLVVEQPGLLEKGLCIHSDAEGHPAGVDYQTPVGGIDLLACDEQGDFVVVMVPSPAEVDDIVPEILQRIGWVRRHLADGADVRGIVVLRQLPEALAYAAAGVAGTVRFKAFRVALSFHDIKA